MSGDQAPRTLHVGSGREFREEWINLDVDPAWQPDVQLDISAPLPATPVLSERFGLVSFGPGSFDRIVAREVLEHIPDLVGAMTNCLSLLTDGGVMEITVPYDLSYGAWQDPTHVRAFNENSFAYFCEWFWYLGWETHRFHKQRLDLAPSELGQQLVAAGVPDQEIRRTPRAIDTVVAELVKRPLDEQDRAELLRHRRR